MAHDFAKRAQQHKRNMSGTKKKEGGLPKGLIFATLVIACGFVAFLYHLARISPLSATHSPLTDQHKDAGVDKTAKPDSNRQPKDLYDFYTLLPESEVIAPRVDAYHSQPKSQINDEYAYMLQAGSFKNSRDADRLRAQLILHGLNAQSSRARTKNGTWYRVMVGPFRSRPELNRAQDILARANTESMLIKIKP